MELDMNLSPPSPSVGLHFIIVFSGTEVFSIHLRTVSLKIWLTLDNMLVLQLYNCPCTEMIT